MLIEEVRSEVQPIPIPLIAFEHLSLYIHTEAFNFKPAGPARPTPPIQSFIAFEHLSLYMKKHLSLSVAVCGSGDHLVATSMPLLDYY